MIDNILILSPTLRAGKMNYSEGEAGRGGQLILYKLDCKWKEIPKIWSPDRKGRSESGERH